MKQYKDLLQKILTEGELRSNRTGIDTYEIPSATMEFNMADGFPLLTTKKMFTKGIIHELLWFLQGSDNIKYLVDNDVHIWDGNAFDFFKKTLCNGVNGKLTYSNITLTKFLDYVKSEEQYIDYDNKSRTFGYLGNVYGVQWRRWSAPTVTLDAELGLGWHTGTVLPAVIDQLANAIRAIQNNPNDRRIRVSAWNVAELSEMALPPCHYEFVLYVHNDGILDLKWSQRSCDTFLGIPFNIASYAFLLHMIAFVTNKKPGMLRCNLDNVHIYVNHIDQVKLQLSREPKTLPKLKFVNTETVLTIDDFEYNNFSIVGYDSWPAIKAEMAV